MPRAGETIEEWCLDNVVWKQYNQAQDVECVIDERETKQRRIIQEEAEKIPKRAQALHWLMKFIHDNNNNINKEMYTNWNTTTKQAPRAGWPAILQWTGCTNCETHSMWRQSAQQKIGHICSQNIDGTISLTKNWQEIVKLF
jgi:hypothetical protein